MDFILRDGAAVGIRPTTSDDAAALLDFFRARSPESLHSRFFGVVGDAFLQEESVRLTRMGTEGGVSLLATAGDDDVIGHASYHPSGHDRAEADFLVAESWQGRGLGTLLVGAIADAAAENGVRRIQAAVLPANHRMLQVFLDSGYEARVRPEPGRLVVEFPADGTPGARERFEEREWLAAATAVEGFFRPRSVAVIGASRRHRTIGGELFRNLLRYGFTGSVFPVNPSASSVQGVFAYPTVEDIPVDVDLAVIVVPASAVLEVVEQCSRKGVRRLVVISAGFSEVGGEGVDLQRTLLQRCRAAGMRVIGPNCMGIVNTDEAWRLNATFAPTEPERGRLAFMSQSGALGLAIMDYAGRLGLGLSTFVSVGNKADISGNDLLRYWADDPSVDVILLYLESFGNPRKFSRIARRVGRRKPIVAVKSGRSPAGLRATSSHTGALISASDTTVDALFRHAGVIRTDTMEEMFDVASVLAHQPPPRGPRVAIVTNAGGPGILCADACAAEGLEVPSLTPPTVDALREMLPSGASPQNPVDMIASASPADFRRAVEIVGRDPQVDAVIAIFVPPVVTRSEDVARSIVEAARALRDEAKPVLTVFMQSRGLPPDLSADDLRLPAFTFPESAAIALARAAHYGAWLARPHTPPARFPDARRGQAASVVARALAEEKGWLDAGEVATILESYGLPVLEQRWCATAEEVEEAAMAIGAPVALKGAATGLVHKTEAGAVALGVEPADARQAATGMVERLRAEGHEIEGFLVQRMAKEGVEMIVGVVHDEHFGPVLACGAGGTLVELLGDVVVRIAPLSEDEARAMLRELRTWPALTGYRGTPPGDVDALVEVVLRVGVMADDLPEIRELDLNPVLVHEQGISLVDARIRVEHQPRTGERPPRPSTSSDQSPFGSPNASPLRGSRMPVDQLSPALDDARDRRPG